MTYTAMWIVYLWEIGAIALSGYIAAAYDVSSAPACTDPDLENPGYSSTFSEGLQYWSHCAFPNPRQDAARCGRTYDASVTYDLCDPDGVLNSTIRNELDTALWSVETTTGYQCTPWHGTVLSYTVLVVAVQYLRVPDLSGNDTCKNSCDELMPGLDVFSREAAEEEKQAALDSFALGLLSNFESYFCDNYVVIAFWQNESMITTALSSGPSSLIPATTVAEVQGTALLSIQNGDPSAGIKAMIAKYHEILLGFTPAWVLLIANMCIIFTVSVVVALNMTFGSKSDYFDEEIWKSVLKVTIKVVFGIWFIENLMMILVKLQNLMRPSFVLLPLAGFFIAAALAVWMFVVDSQEDTAIAALKR